MNVYWGDLHKHLSDMDNIDNILRDARHNLDFYPLLCYPFIWETTAGGLRVETVRQRPEFLKRWERMQTAAREHHCPGHFVTFTGYEWHGNRSRWGDHNVIYFDEDDPLDDTWELDELYRRLSTRKAIAIPHHTAYRPGFRGKDWTVFNPALSPVMEIFSGHGSSEAIDSPVPMLQNVSMGPRTGGGTFVDALNAGYKIGAIASNDGQGLPGGWGKGVAAVLAEQLTRDSLWESILNRRTYASTGDRIEMTFKINDEMMGSIIKVAGQEQLTAEVSLDCPQPLDRVDLIHNGMVLDTYIHDRNWKELPAKGRYRVLLECGGGPSVAYGFRCDETACSWDGTLVANGGKITSVYPRFSNYGQEYEVRGVKTCSFLMKTDRSGASAPVQGVIFEVEGNRETRLDFDIEGQCISLRIADLLHDDHLAVLSDESERRISERFGVQKAGVENPDVYYHIARKIRISPAYHHKLCSADISFKNVPLAEDLNYYYIRASQIDGQTVWSSPIWVEVRD